MSAILRTPQLPRLLADCTERLGFTCLQQIPGVLAWVAHGPLQLQLWACGAPPGRWERPDPTEAQAWPAQVSLVVTQVHALQASLQQAAQRHAAIAVANAEPVPAPALPSVPVLQPWGAWEFAVPLRDGWVVHCVDWTAAPPPHAPTHWRGGSQTAPLRRQEP